MCSLLRFSVTGTLAVLLVVILVLWPSPSRFAEAQQTANNTLPQQTLTVSVTGYFNQTNCSNCDCTSPSCQWIDNYNCSYAGLQDNIQKWGYEIQGDTYLCFTQSGCGFYGLKNFTMTTNPTNNTASKIAQFTHYNNLIDGSYCQDSNQPNCTYMPGNPSSPPHQLQLTMIITSPELTQPFTIVFPLHFIETVNFNYVSQCDPAIQYTSTPCDDRFYFDETLNLQSSFTVDDKTFTLELAGFVNPLLGNNVPIRDLTTEETKVTTVDVYARIISFCAPIDCGSLGTPRGPPLCGCECIVDQQFCSNLYGPNWVVNDQCGCDCGLNASSCPPDLTFNPSSCSCGCNLTDAECVALNPNWGLDTNPDVCACGCNKQFILDCALQNQWFRPQGPNCTCACYITDAQCEALYGPGYTGDSSQCACVVAGGGGGGLSSGAIAGIVIGSVAAAVLLTALIAGLAALLVFLIRSGKMPGIYGYRLDPADFAVAENSPMYQDAWVVPGNVIGSD
jgi:hypothetical protein